MAVKMIKMPILVSKTHTRTHRWGVGNGPRLEFASRLRSNGQVWDYFTWRVAESWIQTDDEMLRQI